jgi:hypothetical protein
VLCFTKAISVDDANANNDELICYHVIYRDAGARALSAVKFEGSEKLNGRKCQGRNKGIAIAVLA